MVVEALGKLAILYAQNDMKADLLNCLHDLKFYTTKNVEDLMKAIEEAEFILKSGYLIPDDFVERLKVLIHKIKQEQL